MKTNVLTKAILASALLGVIACSTDPNESEPSGDNITKLQFINPTFDIYTGEEAVSDLCIYTSNRVEPYTNENQYKLSWTSSTPALASVSDNGTIRGEAIGTTRLSAQTSDMHKQASQTINILRAELLNSPLTNNLIFKKGNVLWDNSVMQSFDFDHSGDTYYTQVGRGNNNHNVILMRQKSQTTSCESRMLLPYSGHGNNIAIEQEGGNTYVWIGSYGTRNNEGDYSFSQTIARIKYTGGKTERPSECTEHYWIPQRKNLQVSLDLANNIALFWCVNSTYTSRYFYIYRLSEIKALPSTHQQLSFSITWGGMHSGEKESTETPTVLVKDLSKLTALATITIPQNSPITVGAAGNQGHDVKNGKIYYYEGAGNNNDGADASTATVSIINFKGELVHRNQVAAITNLGTLSSLGLTNTGYMEPEGIKIHDGIMYCGFATRSKDDIRRVAILQYDLKE